MESSAAKVKRIQRIIRYDVLGSILTFKEIAEIENISECSVRRFCTVYKIKVQRAPYTVSDKVLKARRKRITKVKKSLEQRRRREKALNDLQREQSRIQSMKELAANNILCHRWVS